MAMDGRLLFRAPETTEATGNICLLLGVLLRARIIRIKIKHSRLSILNMSMLCGPRKPSLVIPSMIAPETSGYSALTLTTAFCF